MRRFAVVLFVLTARLAAAHDDDVTLRRLDAALERGDHPATRLLLRAEIERAERRWSAAEADLARAAGLAPGSAAVARCRAALALDRGRPGDALRALDACPDRKLGADPRVPWLRAGALSRLARWDDAASVMDAAIARDPRASAERYLARAAVAEHRREGVPGAIAELERGLARWPGAWNLVSRLLDLDLRLRRYDDALARLDLLLPREQRPERLLARRGDVLALAGRGLEAHEAWTDALAGLEGRPAMDAADREMARRLHASLATPIGAPLAEPGTR